MKLQPISESAVICSHNFRVGQLVRWNADFGHFPKYHGKLALITKIGLWNYIHKNNMNVSVMIDGQLQENFNPDYFKAIDED